MNELQLKGHFLPYSVRRGGATAHFVQDGSLDITCERGRWGNMKTARVYVNTALADKSHQLQPPAHL